MEIPIGPHFEISKADDGRFIIELNFTDRDKDGDPLLSTEQMIELRHLIGLALRREMES